MLQAPQSVVDHVRNGSASVTYVLSCDVDTDLPAWAAVERLANVAVISTAARRKVGCCIVDAALGGATTKLPTAHLQRHHADGPGCQLGCEAGMHQTYKRAQPASSICLGREQHASTHGRCTASCKQAAKGLLTAPCSVQLA